MIPSPDLTTLLTLSTRGDPAAAADAIRLVYDQLHEIAKERCGPRPLWDGLSPTVVVHEAYLRLIDGQAAIEWQDRMHFFAVATIVMRRIVLDDLRSRAGVNGGNRDDGGGDGCGCGRLHLGDAEPSPGSPPAGSSAGTPTYDSVELTEALRRLAELQPRPARIAEWRIFVGLSHPQIAHLLGVPLRTVEAEWALARAWLKLELGSDAAP